MSRSTDSGQSWKDANDGLSDQSILALGAAGNSVFAATYDPPFSVSLDAGETWSMPIHHHDIPYLWSFAAIGTVFLAGGDSGIYRSIDGGLTWNTSNTGMANFAIDALLTQDSTVFAAGCCGGALFRSSDSGASWIQLSSDVGTYTLSTLAALGPDMFVSNGRTILRSTDRGRTWPDTEHAGNYAEIVRLIAIEGKLFAATGRGVYVSIDSGSTWVRTDWGKDDGGSPGWEVSDLVARGTNLFAVAVYHMQENADSESLFLSTDEGVSWRNITDGLRYLGRLALGDHDLFVGSLGVWRRPLWQMIPGLSVKESATLQVGFTLRASPNPFVDRVSIEYDASVREGVELRIFNSLGIETARLFSGMVESGTHSFTWDASGVAPGLYECIVRTRDGMRSLPIVLMR